MLRRAWEGSSGVDGYVSVEDSPDLAYGTPATAVLARHLHDEAGFPNLLVKIPGIAEGPGGDGRDHGCRGERDAAVIRRPVPQTAEAYLRALERRFAAGQSLDVTSVASVLVSRWDKAADPVLPAHLHATRALAMAKKTYASYRNLLSGER